MISLFLAALDQTIVATALPAIVVAFNAIDQLSWVSTGYLLASTTMVPIYGKLSDLYGRRAILLFGIVVFLAGSCLCGLAGSMLQLIVYRVIQGVGAAALTSTAFAIPADLFPPAERARYQGMFGAVFGLASVIGPYLGGLLTDNFSWRWVFYVNLPVGIIALSFIVLKMPKLASGLRAPIDWLGATLLPVAVIPLLLGLTLDKAAYPWGSPLILGLFGLAAVTTALFLFVELRVASPIIPLDLFRNRTFAVVSGVSVLNGAAFFAAILFLSIFMVNVVGVSATAAGTTLIPLTMGLVVGSLVASFLVQRIGRYKPIIITGFVIMIAGFWLLSQMSVSTTQGGVTWRMLVLGLGIGPGLPLLNLALQNAVPFEKVGAATASRQFFQQIGQTLGAAVFGVILSATLTAQLSASFAPIQAELPPAIQSRLSPDQFRNGNTGAEGGAAQLDAGERITGQLEAGFARSRELVTAAIRDDDPQARTALLADPQIPEALKVLVRAGADEELAPEQRDQALQTALRALDQAEAQARERADAIGSQIARAVRQSFATSITRIYLYALVPIIIALFVLLAGLPELPLRKTNRSEAPVPAFD
jgi:EmrB/QacA subfamily drug resistance transporter